MHVILIELDMERAPQGDLSVGLLNESMLA